jgi:hypothetical protein
MFDTRKFFTFAGRTLAHCRPALAPVPFSRKGKAEHASPFRAERRREIVLTGKRPTGSRAISRSRQPRAAWNPRVTMKMVTVLE